MKCQRKERRIKGNEREKEGRDSKVREEISKRMIRNSDKGKERLEKREGNGERGM